jgi:protein SCO1/2
VTFQNKKSGIFFIILFIALVLITGNYIYASIKKQNLPQKLTASTLYPTPKQLGQFSLVQKTDNAIGQFDEQKLRDQWHLIFMGYTSCPHICPTEMTTLSHLYQQLPSELKNQIQIIMVTTDPLKDTPEILYNYVQNYHQDFIGLSGTKSQIATFAKQFSMPFFPSEETDKNKPYEVNHSASFYLTNPDGELYAVFSTPHNVENIYADLLHIMAL